MFTSISAADSTFDVSIASNQLECEFNDDVSSTTLNPDDEGARSSNGVDSHIPLPVQTELEHMGTHDFYFTIFTELSHTFKCD